MRSLHRMHKINVSVRPSACFISSVLIGLQLNFVLWGLRQESSGEFNFDSYRSNINSTFNEAQIELYRFSRKRLIVQKITACSKLYISLRSETSV